MNLVDSKPQRLTQQMISHFLKDHYGLELIDFSELISYDDRNYLVHVTDKHSNPHLKQVDTNGYLMKVFNSKLSEDGNYFDGVYSLTEYIRQRGIPTPERIPDVNGQLMSLEKFPTDTKEDGGGGDGDSVQYMVLLQTFLPGMVISKVPLLPPVFYQFGKLIGSMHESLKDFHHSYFDGITDSSWSLRSVPQLKQFATAIKEEKDRSLIEHIVDTYVEEIIPALPKFQKGQIHGDLNDLNVLVKESKPVQQNNDSKTSEPNFVISGIIDFADATHSYFVFDVAIAIAYMMINCTLLDPIDITGHLLAGYLSEFNMNQAERDALYVLICCRFAQSLAIGWHTYVKDPSNEYPILTAAAGWPLLRRLWQEPRNAMEQRWNDTIKSYEQLP
ncbi:hydroxylysine kinase-like [Argonauta hians]